MGRRPGELDRMMRDGFVNLFSKGSGLQRAARKWWDQAAACDHPYGKLWFRHWEQEVRAHPAIASAFRVAHEQDLIRNLKENPFDLLLALQAACKQGRGDPRSLGHRKGPLIRVSADDGKLVTMIEVRLLNRDRMSDEAVRTGVSDEKEQQRRRRRWSNRWVCPEADVTPLIPAHPDEIDTVRDRLGLPHWRQSKVKVVLVWGDAAQTFVRIPTMLDGGWAFFRPVPTGYTWGWTVDLKTGGKGVREGVIPGDFEDSVPAEHDRRVRVFRIRKEIPKDDQYHDLCDHLCRKKTTLSPAKRAKRKRASK